MDQDLALQWITLASSLEAHPVQTKNSRASVSGGLLQWSITASSEEVHCVKTLQEVFEWTDVHRSIVIT